MKPLPDVEEILGALRRRGIEAPAGNVQIGAYGDSPELSAALIRLIVDGTKTATTALVWSHEAEDEPLPAVGDVEIVVDHRGSPVAITRVTRCSVLPFDEVGAEHAALEGEGDRSLEHWRRAHWAFFSRECARIGRTPDPTMPVVCSEFELVRVIRPEGATERPGRPSA